MKLMFMVGIPGSVRSQLKVVKITPLDYEDTLYDIQTSTENFIANGMISHNCFAPLVLKKDKETFHKDFKVRDEFLEKLEKDC